MIGCHVFAIAIYAIIYIYIYTYIYIYIKCIYEIRKRLEIIGLILIMHVEIMNECNSIWYMKFSIYYFMNIVKSSRRIRRI